VAPSNNGESQQATGILTEQQRRWPSLLSFLVCSQLNPVVEENQKQNKAALRQGEMDKKVSTAIGLS
jgi:hypothetical protein